jgi:hypothetical protein
MEQLSIQFFWPLTEQIPLELDYTDCAKKVDLSNKNFGILGGGNGFRIVDTGVITSSTVLNINEDSVKLSLKETPPWYRRIMFELLGIKWEKR